MSARTEHHEYARRQIQEILVARHKIEGIGICESIPLPQALHREQRFYENVKVCVHLLYAAPWVYCGTKALLILLRENDWRWSVFVWAAVSVVFNRYHLRWAVGGWGHGGPTGLFYPLDLWVQSLEHRKMEFRGECRRIYLETAPKKFN